MKTDRLDAPVDIQGTDPLFWDSLYPVSIEQPDDYLYQKLGGDYRKYLDLRRDPYVRSRLARRRQAILSRVVLFECGEGQKLKEKKAIALATEIHDRINYESICSALIDTGQLIGFSVIQIDWENRGGYIVPVHRFVPQRRFVFTYHYPDNDSIPIADDLPYDPTEDIVLVQGYELRLLTRREPVFGERCPRSRFFVYCFDANESPWGLGLGYSIYPYVEVKRRAFESWLLHSTRAGKPPVYGNQREGVNRENPDDKKDLDTFSKFLKGISPSAWASLPFGYEVKVVEALSQVSEEVHEKLIETAERQISVAILGEQLFSDKPNGSYAANDSQQETIDAALIDADVSVFDEQAQRQLWEPIAMLNYRSQLVMVRRESVSDRRQQAIAKQEAEEELTRVDRDATVVGQLGLQMKDEYIEEKYPDFERLEEEPLEEGAIGGDSGELPDLEEYAEGDRDRISVDDPQILAFLLDWLDDRATGVRKVFNVTIDGDDIFRGHAKQPLPNGRSQYLAWRMDSNSGKIGYRIVKPSGNFAEPDGFEMLTIEGDTDNDADGDADGDAIEFAATRRGGGKGSRKGKKLNCKAGNVQCGGKCQGEKLACNDGLTPEEKKKAQAAARKAKTKGAKAGAIEASRINISKTEATPNPAKESKAIASTSSEKSKAKSTKAKSGRSDLTKVDRSDYKALIDSGRSQFAKYQEEWNEIDKDAQNFRESYRRAKELNALLDSDDGSMPIQRMEAIENELEGLQTITSQKDALIARSNALMEKFRSEMKRSSGVTAKEAKEWAENAQVNGVSPNDSRLRKFRQDLAEFYQLTGGNARGTLDRIEIAEGREFARKEDRMISVTIDRPEALWHEAAHHIEFNSFSLHYAAKEFVKSKAVNNQPERLKDIVRDGSSTHRDDEIAYRGNFMHPYVGRVYKGTEATEVISMGVEKFQSPLGMGVLASKDIDHFYLTIGMLTAERKPKKPKKR